MSIRFPLKTVLDYNDSGNTGATSVVSQTFTIPQDTDTIVVKVPVASINGTNPVADIYLQTTDDGGTTYYDILRLPQVTGTTIANAGALWGVANVNGLGFRSTQSGLSSLIQTSVLSVTGNASVRSLGSGQSSGLPIMGPLNRIQISYAGTIAANNGVQVQVKVNSQGATV